jgi:hypothetical protein
MGGNAVEFMLLFSEPRGACAPVPADMAEMTKLANALAREGKLRRGAPLDFESAGARVRVLDGRAFVTDGPFIETREVVGGFWIVDVASREEAIEIARRCPHVRRGSVEVHRVRERSTWTDSGSGTPFLFAYRVEPGLTDPDGAKFKEMVAFGAGLAREGKLLEAAPLANEPPPARIEAKGGQTLVTDGPFAESKEAVGGYGLVRVAGRAEAVDLAKRIPHARWGPIEVREILFFDRV